MVAAVLETLSRSLVAVSVASIVFVHVADAEGRKVLVHLKTGITQDDNQMCVAFNIAQAAQEAGDQVEMFFDAAAVFDLQSAPTQGPEGASQPTSQPAGDTTPYNLKYELPDKLKKILSAQFNIPVTDLPSDYFGYLKMLKDDGASVTFNGAMAHLVSLSNSVSGAESMTDIATPLDLRQIIEHRAAADIYIVY